MYVGESEEMDDFYTSVYLIKTRKNVPSCNENFELLQPFSC